MVFEEIVKKKSLHPNEVLIVVDGNKASIGWKEAREFAEATGCSLGFISYDGNKVSWVVRKILQEIKTFFEKKERNIVIVDGNGDTLQIPTKEFRKGNDKKEESLSKHEEDVSESTVSISKERELSSSKPSKNTSYKRKKKTRTKSKSSDKKGKAPKKKRDSLGRVIDGRSSSRDNGGQNIIKLGSVFDTKGSSKFKKANPVNTTRGQSITRERAKEIEETRSFVDKELHPHGVRYGDAYRFRKNKKR